MLVMTSYTKSRHNKHEDNLFHDNEVTQLNPYNDVSRQTHKQTTYLYIYIDIYIYIYIYIHISIYLKI